MSTSLNTFDFFTLSWSHKALSSSTIQDFVTLQVIKLKSHNSFNIITTVSNKNEELK
jgi:hypothetical protein